MFDKFGEFDSYEELNRAAEGLFNEGDTDNIYVLAEENGIGREYADMYIAGELPFLADSTLAAGGKIDTELLEAVQKYGDTAECVAEYVKSLCDRQEFALLVRKKDRKLIKCLDKMYEEAKKTKKGNCSCIPPSKGFSLIRDYYIKGEGK